MKKGDKPKDLSQSWWSKNKAKTMKSSGLGAALGAYEKQRAKPKSLEYFKATLKELNKIPAAVDKAKKLCDKKLHAETLEALGGYAAVISKEMNEIAKEETDYTKRLSLFKSTRVQLLKEVKQAEQDIGADNKKLGEGLKKLKKLAEKKDSVEANKLAVELRKLAADNVKAVNAILAKVKPWREGEPPYNQGALDVADRDDAGGRSTLETINPLTVSLGKFKTNGESAPTEITELLKDL